MFPIIQSNWIKGFLVFNHRIPQGLQSFKSLLGIRQNLEHRFTSIRNNQGFPAFFHLAELFQGLGFKFNSYWEKYSNQIYSERLERASLAREVEKELKKEGLSLEDLIADLRTQRERYASKALPRD